MRLTLPLAALLATPALANNIIFSNYGPQCQSCLDNILAKCNDGTGTPASIALCFCGGVDFVKQARACGTGVCASENAATAGNVASDLLLGCCKTLYWQDTTQCAAYKSASLSPFPRLVWTLFEFSLPVTAALLVWEVMNRNPQWVFWVADGLDDLIELAVRMHRLMPFFNFLDFLLVAAP